MSGHHTPIEPCDHVPIYRRIRIGPERSTAPPLPTSLPQPVYAEQQARLAEGDRIWALVRQTAEGCNAPPASLEMGDHN